MDAAAATAPITTRAWLTGYAMGAEMWKPLNYVNAVVDILEAAGLQEQKQVRRPAQSGSESCDDSHTPMCVPRTPAGARLPEH